jgi:GNAT superfamily N-acetyltransferase
MSERFAIRLATIADAALIATHRARMFQDMGDLPPEPFETLREKSLISLRALLARGEYIGWLALPVQDLGIVAGGAGVQIRHVLPHPLTRSKGAKTIAQGRHAIILNVFTEPEWRRQGVALLLLRRIIEWSRDERLDSLVLHSSEAGRSLYERLGFVRTNEMRLAGTIDDDLDTVINQPEHDRDGAIS